MGDLVSNQNIVAIKGSRVVTTSFLAESYEVDPVAITKNFNNNKSRYTEGKHYFLLSGKSLSEFGDKFPHLGITKMSRKLYLWTERGALYHAKSLNSDKAWDVFDVLVESYFQRKVDGRSEHDMQLLRLSVKENRKMETDEIKKYVEYCVHSGMEERKANRYYSTITTETYKALGIDKGRDDMSAHDLIKLQAAEQVIGVALANAISNAIPCRECYYVAKDQLIAYSDIVKNNSMIESKE